MNYDPRRGLYLPDSIPPKAQGFPPHLDIPDDVKGKAVTPPASGHQNHELHTGSGYTVIRPQAGKVQP